MRRTSFHGLALPGTAGNATYTCQGSAPRPPAAVRGWQAYRAEVDQRLAPCFRRPEARQRAAAYLDGLQNQEMPPTPEMEENSEPGTEPNQ